MLKVRTANTCRDHKLLLTDEKLKPVAYMLCKHHLGSLGVAGIVLSQQPPLREVQTLPILHAIMPGMGLSALQLKSVHS